MKLRKGKTKSILASSIDSALLGVEIYNKPRTAFRSEGFITMMIIAWTRLFHAHFNSTIGEKYYYMSKGRYEIVDGEKKAWDLMTCIKKSQGLDEAVKNNLFFFIKLRNKIEHRHIEQRDVDVLIFGECQSLLFNFENHLINLFGEEFSINEALVYSLQFSQIRTQQQKVANKSVLSKDFADIAAFVQKFRTSLEEDIYNSQNYSIKLVQIPKISNTNRADAAIEFVRLDKLSAEDRAAYEQLTVLIQDKKVPIEAANVGRLKSTAVVNRVNEELEGTSITSNLHVVLYKLFKIRPQNGSDEPFDTVTEFCLYDEVHNDYVYQDAWVTFLVQFIQNTEYDAATLRLKARNGETFAIEGHR